MTAKASPELAARPPARRVLRRVGAVAVVVVVLAAILVGGAGVLYRGNQAVLDEAPRRSSHGLQLVGLGVGARASLEAELAKADGSRYLEHHRLLKLYLMLAEPEHMDPEWAAGQLTRRWAELAHAGAKGSRDELRELARPYVRAYIEALANRRLAPLVADQALVERVRAALGTAPEEERYDAIFVEALIDERIDETADPTPDNLVFPPVSLPQIFRDRPEVLQHIESRAHLETGRYPEVQGPYTERGRVEVTNVVKRGMPALEDEAWVVAIPVDPIRFPKLVNATAKRYEEEYARQWLAFFNDLRVPPPPDSTAALERYRVLTTQPYPVGRLLEVLENETQWKPASDDRADPRHVIAALRGKPIRIEQIKPCRHYHCGGTRSDVDLRQIAKTLDRIPQHFRDTVGFSRAGAHGPGDSDFSTYTEELRRLRTTIAGASAASRTLSLHAHAEVFARARAATERQLDGYDGTAKEILRPLLVNPLEVGTGP